MGCTSHNQHKGSQGVTKLYSVNQGRMPRGLEYPVILLACFRIFAATATIPVKRLPAHRPGQLSSVLEVYFCSDSVVLVLWQSAIGSEFVVSCTWLISIAVLHSTEWSIFPGAGLPWVCECRLGLSVALMWYDEGNLPPSVTCYLVKDNLCWASR